jgi:O-antigen/teichoic acid export membrane protein
MAVKALIERLHRSIFFSAVERYGGAFFFLDSTAILSRLLKPGGFGVYAAVLALTSVATALFQEFGGSNYLVQSQR